MLFHENLDAFLEAQRQRLEIVSQARIPEEGIILKVLRPPANQARSTHRTTYSVTEEVPEIQVTNEGLVGERHYGRNRLSTGREGELYPKDTLITQRRHLFAISPHDCALLSDRLGCPVTPELLGANIVIGRMDGEPYSISCLPSQTHLVIAPPEATECPLPGIATLAQYVAQRGCGLTGAAIAATADGISATQFTRIARENRGILCSVEHPVERPATLKAGQRVFFRFPQYVCL